MVEKGKIYEYLPLILMMGGLIVGQLPIFPLFIRQYSMFIAMAFAFAGVAFVEIGIKLKAAEYLYIEAIVRPTQKKLCLWITEPKEGIKSTLINSQYQTYETPLDLGRPAEYGMYKDITHIDLEHDLPWEKRMIFMPGKALWDGYPISHNKVAHIELWEPEQDAIRFDFLHPIPRFLMASAPRDWLLLKEPSVIGQGNGQVSTSNETEEVLRAKLVKAESDVSLWKSRFLKEQQLRARLHGIVEMLENQFEGILSRTRDVTKLVVEQVLALIASHATLTGAGNEIRQRKWMIMGKYVAAVVIVGFLGYLLYTSESFRTWMSSMVIPILVGLGLVIAGIYMFRQRR